MTFALSQTTEDQPDQISRNQNEINALAEFYLGSSQYASTTRTQPQLAARQPTTDRIIVNEKQKDLLREMFADQTDKIENDISASLKKGFPRASPKPTLSYAS